MILYNFRRISTFRNIQRCSQVYQVKSYSTSSNQDENNNNHRKQQKSYLFTSVGLIVSAICTIKIVKNKDDFLNILPYVEAKTVIKLEGRRQKNNFIADVVDLCASSVVYIEIKDKRRLDYYTGEPITVSNGSGFIINSNGLILTNAHVVINKPHTKVQVRLSDGRIFPGVVEDVDQFSDLATIRIECNKLPVMKMGESSSLRNGEWVVALGSPLSLSNTITAGVVSNTQRPSHELGLRNSNINYIQTDAAITFGNSGGPLVNLDGEAIGINSMKVTSGISFAIPIDYVKQFLLRREERQSKTGARQGYPVRRYLGITMLTLTEDMLHEMKTRSHTVSAEVQNGVLVWKVILGSPADMGGLRPGDIITTINRKVVKSSSDVYEILSNNENLLEMEIYRGLKKMNISVKPEDP